MYRVAVDAGGSTLSACAGRLDAAELQAHDPARRSTAPGNAATASQSNISPDNPARGRPNTVIFAAPIFFHVTRYWWTV